MGRRQRRPGSRLSGDADPAGEVDDELDFHLRQRADELRQQGLPAAEARRRAEEEFGDLAATRRYCAAEDRRRARRRRLLGLPRALADELRLALRAVARRPGAVLAPAGILATAVALNALVFTVVRGVLFSPLPFPDPERVVAVDEVTEQYGLSRVSYPVLAAWRRDARTVEDVTAYLETELPLVRDIGTTRVRGVAVTQGFFGLLDSPMLSGRAFDADAHRPDAPPAVLLSERLWRHDFGADPGILRRTLRLGGRDVPVLGVVREGRGFPEGADLWIALEPTSPELMDVAGAKILVGLARLGPGTTPEAAARELGGISSGVAGGAPHASAVTISRRLLGDVRTPLLLLEGAVLLVLLAACANAGGMLLARGVRRRAELAVRASVGAGSVRVAGGLLLEGALLGLSSGVVGLGMAAALLKPALALVPDDLPHAAAVALDPVVAAFALALALATGVVTALAPALTGSRTRPAALLREAAPGAGEAAWLRRLLEGFVVTQVALAVLLTAGAGLLLRSFVATVTEDPGFDPTHVTVMDVALPDYRYPDVGARLAFAHELLRRASDLPGATAVALGRNLPISGSTMTSPLLTADGTQTGQVQVALVSAGYFDVMRIPVKEGRGFEGDDREGGPPVLLVDPDIRTAEGDAIGVGTQAHSFYGGPDGPDGPREVVGVVGAVRHDGLRAAPPPTAYEPFFQKGGAAGFSLLVRSDAPAAVVAQAARNLLVSMDTEIPADGVGTMSARISRSVAGPRFYTVVLSVFGILAVVLALAGCQAGLAHRVAARRREIGLRMALGASQPGVRGMVLRRGLALTGAGATIGFVLSLPATRLLDAQLYGVAPGDPVTYVGLLVLLLLAAALASDLPARRAAKVDPAETLRES
jgi:putative ABC transport system permease protein